MNPSSGGVNAAHSGRTPRWATLSVTLVLLVLALRVLGSVRVIDLDLFHEMALAREAFAMGFVPHEDLFAYTSTVTPSIHHEWATGVVLYGLTVGMGLGSAGLAVLRFVLLATVAFFCWKVARSRGAGPVELALIAPLAILLFWPGVAPVRAHMFTFVFLSMLLYFLELDRLGSRRWLLIWPALYVLWLNMHGGFVVGAGLLGLYSVESLVRQGRGKGWEVAWKGNRHLLFATALTIPLVLVNPYGLDYVPYMWHALLLDRPLIPEWAPLWAPEFRGAPLMLFLASLVVVLYTALRSPDWRKLPGLLLVLVAALFAFRSIRILPIYVITLVCYVTPALAATPAAELVRNTWTRFARPIGATALVLAAIGMWNVVEQNPLSLQLPTTPEGELQAFPAGAVDYLADVGFQGNLMTPFGVGAFVSWYLYPDVKVGLDSRYEVAYSPEFVEEAIGVYDGQGEWREFLGRHATDAVLVATDAPLDSILSDAATRGSAPWIQTFRDDAYAIYVRPELVTTLPAVDRRGHPIPARFP